MLSLLGPVINMSLLLWSISDHLASLVTSLVPEVSLFSDHLLFLLWP